MKETGKVISVRRGFATVRINRKSACGSCNACGMKPSDPHIDIEFINTVNAKVDDSVEVEMAGGSVAKLSLVAYAIPLAVGLALFGVVYALSLPEWAAFIALIAGVGGGMLFLKPFEKKWKKEKANLHRIVSVVEDKPVTNHDEN